MSLMVSKAEMRRFQIRLKTIPLGVLERVVKEMLELKSRNQLDSDEILFLDDIQTEIKRRLDN